MSQAASRRVQPRLVAAYSVSAQRGFALITVLAILFAITISSASFIWFMQQLQTRSGIRHRSASAMAAAEAGIHRALSALETTSPDGGGPGRYWRPTAYRESVRIGALEGWFTVSVADGADGAGGAIAITSVGDVTGVTRRLRAHAQLTSPALLASLNGASVIRLERPPAATVVLPYETAIQNWPWIQIAAGRGIWLATSDVYLNNRSTNLVTGPGPLDTPAYTPDPTPGSRPMPARVAMPRGAELTIGPDQQRVDVQQLRAMGVQIQSDILRSEELTKFPEVDRAFYAALATANVANAHLNRAAGTYLGDDNLAQKQDSLYSQREFEQVQIYAATGLMPARFSGVVYVRGRMLLPEGQSMQVTDGALVTEGTAVISPRSSLEVTHSARTRSLPGIITLDYGPLVVGRGARLRVHGLTYASRFIYIDENARVDIVGSVLGSDQALSFRNTSGVVVIRYDPAVLGTPGLRVPADAPVIVWVSAWEELP